MNRQIIHYLLSLFAVIFAMGIHVHFAIADTAIDIEAILVNTAPPGQPGRDYDAKTGDAKKSGGLNDLLWIKVNNKDIKPEEAVLYLNGIAMKSSVAEGVLVAADSSWLKYRLDRKKENQETWQSLLARPETFTKQVVVNIGKLQERPIGKYAKFEFINVPEAAFWITTIATIILLIIFIHLARTSEIIRDRGPKADESKRRTYSLALTQMAFWTFVVTISYGFIFIITGDLDTVSGSTLVLIGIGAVTAVSGATMDANKRKKNEAMRLEDIKKLDELKTKSPQPTGEIQEIQDRITQRESATKVLATEGFLNDILTDVDGVTIHRFQLVIWTIILGGIFLVKVHETLAMPQFSTELLSLMGISAGTYLGFKIPEKQTNN
jgi:hypothetical protein